MIFGKRKREKIRQNIIDNLTLCRLEADLYAVEAAIRDNEPKAANDEGGCVKRFINGIINDINNTARRFATRELSVDREKARKALSDFRAQHSAKEFDISRNAEEFSKYIDKNMFKKDKYGIDKLTFALIFAIDTRDIEYQCPEESLEVVSEILFGDSKRLGKLYNSYKNNYYAVKKGKHGVGDGESEGNDATGGSYGLFTKEGFVGYVKHLLFRKSEILSLKCLTPSETEGAFALYLTLIEHNKRIGDEKLKEMINELLERVDNLRADAEYKWYVEGVNVPECRRVIKSADHTVERLGKILGI